MSIQTKALIALAMMMTTRTRTTTDASGQDGFTTPDSDGSSFEAENAGAETAGAESAAGSQTASGAEVTDQHTSGTAGKQTNE